MINVELDEAVATRVMGWKRGDGEIMSQGWLERLEDGPWCWAGWLSVEPRIIITSSGYEEQEPFNIMGTARFAPASDIAAAWLVVERLRDKPWHYDVNLLGAGLEGSWWCYIRTLRHSRTIAEATEPTVCRAICVATLAAIAKGKP